MRKKVISRVVRVNRPRGVVFMARASTVSLFLSGVGISLLIMGLISVGVPIVPLVWYRLKPSTVGTLGKVLKKPVFGFTEALEEAHQPVVPYQPPFDPTLPAENRLVVERIGINTPILERSETNYEEALKLGVWRVPNFGTAYERSKPMILVAHRFGYLEWSNKYRRANSFYNLPKLEVGDRVTVIWGQRKYTYEIYGGEESAKVHDYTADLVLYTCKFLESDVRIFRYARLVVSN